MATKLYGGRKKDWPADVRRLLESDARSKTSTLEFSELQERICGRLDRISAQSVAHALSKPGPAMGRFRFSQLTTGSWQLLRQSLICEVRAMFTDFYEEWETAGGLKGAYETYIRRLDALRAHECPFALTQRMKNLLMQVSFTEEKTRSSLTVRSAVRRSNQVARGETSANAKSRRRRSDSEIREDRDQVLERPYGGFDPRADRASKISSTMYPWMPRHITDFGLEHLCEARDADFSVALVDDGRDGIEIYRKGRPGDVIGLYAVDEDGYQLVWSMREIR